MDLDWHPAYIELPGNNIIRKADPVAFNKLESTIKTWGATFKLYDAWQSLAEQADAQPEDRHPDAAIALAALEAFQNHFLSTYNLRVSLTTTWDNYYKWIVKSSEVPEWIRNIALLVT